MHLERRLQQAGFLNSLAQTLLKAASPGIPDFYQGSEVWDISLANPDNRRPVEYHARKAMLQDLDAREEKDGAEATARALMCVPESAGIKMWVTSRLLRFRRAQPDLFAHGSYSVLRSKGPRNRNLIAFGRAMRGQRMIALVGRFFAEIDAIPYPDRALGIWKETTFRLPAEFAGLRYRDILTGRVFEPISTSMGATLTLHEVLDVMPVALLTNVETA